MSIECVVNYTYRREAIVGQKPTENAFSFISPEAIVSGDKAGSGLKTEKREY
jgi:hypothetical protein